MKLNETITHNFGIMTLNDNDNFIVEMANFLADVTDLPANIVLWTKPQPEELPHTKYRIKVFKDRIHVSTYTIGQHPELLWQHNRNKFRLSSDEHAEVVNVIEKYSSIFIQIVDNKLNTDDAKYEIKKLRGQ